MPATLDVKPLKLKDKFRGCLHEGRKIVQYQEDPRERIILAPYVFCFRFTCKGLYLFLEAGIFLGLGSSQLTRRKILVLGRSQHHVNCLRQEDPGTREKNRQKQRRVVQWLIMAIKADHFVCDNSTERKLLTPVKRAEGLLNKIPQLNFLYISQDECQAGCITGRVLHLHVPTLARIACCLVHQGQKHSCCNLY